MTTSVPYTCTGQSTSHLFKGGNTFQRRFVLYIRVLDLPTGVVVAFQCITLNSSWRGRGGGREGRRERGGGGREGRGGGREGEEGERGGEEGERGD